MADYDFLKDAQLNAAYLSAVVSYNAILHRPDLSTEEKLTTLYTAYEFLNALMDELEKTIDVVKSNESKN